MNKLEPLQSCLCLATITKHSNLHSIELTDCNNNAYGVYSKKLLSSNPSRTKTQETCCNCQCCDAARASARGTSSPVWPEKKSPNVYKICPKNEFTRNMKDFNTCTKIAWEYGRFGQINCCQRLKQVAQSAKNRPIWSHWYCPRLIEYSIMANGKIEDWK